MGYSIKEINKRIGLTRDVIRNYEKKGIIPKNVNGKYRDFSEEEIEELWQIRVLQNIGYSLDEIKDMQQRDSLLIPDNIQEKIEQLEKEGEALKLHIQHAKTIELFGFFPPVPVDYLEVNIDDYCNQIKEKWNVEKATGVDIQSLFNSLFEQDSQSEQSEQLKGLYDMMDDKMNDTEFLLVNKVLPLEIIKRKDLGVSSKEVQLLAQILYEHAIQLEEFKNYSKELFAKVFAMRYLLGGIAEMYKKIFGESGCAFLGIALLYFSGDKELVELIDKELRRKNEDNK